MLGNFLYITGYDFHIVSDVLGVDSKSGGLELGPMEISHTFKDS